MSARIPRLLASELEPQLAEALRPRVERLGYLGEFFQCAAHQPEALLSFQRFTEDLKRALPDRLAEVVALTVASLMENAYERVQHERLSLKLGFGEAWVREVLRLDPVRRAAMTAEDRVVQDLAVGLLARRGKHTADELDAVIDAIGHPQAIAVLMLVGRYVTHALIVNCLHLEPPVASPLKEG
jgi:hypothetical protein